MVRERRRRGRRCALRGHGSTRRDAERSDVAVRVALDLNATNHTLCDAQLVSADREPQHVHLKGPRVAQLPAQPAPTPQQSPRRMTKRWGIPS